MVLRPILDFRVTPLHHRQGKFPFLTTYRHTQYSLLRIPHILCHIQSLRLPFLSSSLPLFPTDSTINFAGIHTLLTLQMGVFGFHDIFTPVSSLECHLWSLFYQIYRRFRLRNVRLKCALFHLQIFPLNFLLLYLGLTLHMVDKKKFLNCIPTLLWGDVDLLILQEILKLLTRFLTKGLGKLAGRCQGLRPEGQFLWRYRATFPRHSFLIEKLEILYDELLLFRTEKSTISRTRDYDSYEFLQFLRTQSAEGLLFCQNSHNFLDHLPIRLIFIGIQVNIENFLKNRQSDQRVDILISHKLREFRKNLLQNEYIGIFVNLRGHHQIYLLPRGLYQHLFLFLTTFSILVQQTSHIALTNDRFRTGKDLRTEKVFLRSNTHRFFFRESLEDIVSKATAMTGSNLFGQSVYLWRSCVLLFFGPIDLHPKLLYLHFFRTLVILLIIDKFLQSSFLFSVSIGHWFERALYVLLIEGGSTAFGLRQCLD